MEKPAEEIRHQTHTLQRSEVQDMDGEIKAREQTVLNIEEK